MGTERPERKRDLPRDPDPPARALYVDKQDPATPIEAPEPVAPEVESARLLANQARQVLAAEGWSDRRIDQLAEAFVAKDLGDDLDEFVGWARVEGPAGPGADRVL